VIPGVSLHSDQTTNISTAAALAAVAWSDVTVLALGLDHGLEHEGMDRSNTELPPAQLDFALRVLAVGKPVALLMVNGGILSIDDLLNPAAVPTGNCSAAGVYEHGIDLRNTVNQTWGPLGSLSGSVEACCSKCAARVEPSPCRFFT
jgi:hypothetical protein